MSKEDDETPSKEEIIGLLKEKLERSEMKIELLSYRVIELEKEKDSLIASLRHERYEGAQARTVASTLRAMSSSLKDQVLEDGRVTKDLFKGKK